MSGPERTLRDEIAAALIMHDHPFRNSLTRPEDPAVMLRTDPKFWVCAQALSQADAVLPVVQARIDAARADTAEAIAQAIEAEQQETRDAVDPEQRPHPERVAGYDYAINEAARIAREHAKGAGG